MLPYLKDPEQIERQSFRQIKQLTDLSGFDADQQQVVMRLVHTCGHPDLAGQVKISAAAIAHGLAALRSAGPVLCDVEMVRHGLAARLLAVQPQCFLNHAAVPALARRRGESRSMCALEHWRPLLKDSIAIIGNAPTALYRLMEMLEQGADKPALIIATPVGFIGAAESKHYLWQQRQLLGVECITVLGRSGGSALAAAAFNALARLQNGQRF